MQDEGIYYTGNRYNQHFVLCLFNFQSVHCSPNSDMPHPDHDPLPAEVFATCSLRDRIGHWFAAAPPKPDTDCIRLPWGFVWKWCTHKLLVSLFKMTKNNLDDPLGSPILKKLSYMAGLFVLFENGKEPLNPNGFKDHAPDLVTVLTILPLFLDKPMRSFFASK